MPKGKNQKLKLYRLSQIMVEKTDEDHYLTIPEIKTELEKYEIEADRKSLYDDLAALSVLGLSVEKERIGRDYCYHVVAKPFEIAELKLLVDSIQASKFITERKSRQLIKKLMGNASKYEADQLNRQVVVSGRIKTMNESIYYNVDGIHHAINYNSSITFTYLKWNTDKELVPRRDELYEVSPWALTWDDENYYMIGFDHRDSKIKHYRVDKMKNIRTTDRKRIGRDVFEEIDMASYTRQNFGMFGGEDTMVKLRFKDDLVGVIIDRFGKDIMIHPVDESGWSETNVEVAVSGQFFGWVFGLDGGVRITGPKPVVNEYKKRITNQAEVY